MIAVALPAGRECRPRLVRTRLLTPRGIVGVLVRVPAGREPWPVDPVPPSAGACVLPRVEPGFTDAVRPQRRALRGAADLHPLRGPVRPDDSPCGPTGTTVTGHGPGPDALCGSSANPCPACCRRDEHRDPERPPAPQPAPGPRLRRPRRGVVPVSRRAAPATGRPARGRGRAGCRRRPRWSGRPCRCARSRRRRSSSARSGRSSGSSGCRPVAQQPQVVGERVPPGVLLGGHTVTSPFRGVQPFVGVRDHPMAPTVNGGERTNGSPGPRSDRGWDPVRRGVGRLGIHGR